MGIRNAKSLGKLRISHFIFRIRFTTVPIQAISWVPSGAVRILDQRALPEAEITRDLESAESVAEAIKQLQVRARR